MRAATEHGPAHQEAGPSQTPSREESGKSRDGVLGRARSAYQSQTESEEARTLIHRLGDHFSGIAYAGIVMILAAVMITEGASVVNVSAVDTIETELLNSFTTGASLVVLLILAIVFGYALSYMEFASMGGGGSGSGGSRT
jgi:hypothetical protein